MRGRPQPRQRRLGRRQQRRHSPCPGTRCRQVVLLNNDTVVAPDFVARLTAAAAAHPAYGVLGPVIRFMDPPHEVQTDGCLFNEPAQPGFFQRKPVRWPRRRRRTITEVDIVNGCCMMIRADVFRRIGLIDERFFLIHEESDFCLRARRAGFRCGVLGEALVWHKGSSSFKRSGAALAALLRRPQPLPAALQARRAHRGGRGPLRSLWEYSSTPITATPSSARPGSRRRRRRGGGGVRRPGAAVRPLPHRIAAGLPPAARRLRGLADGSDPPLLRARPLAMRLLFVKEALAWPRSSGHDVHCFHMMRALAALGHEVSLATVKPAADEALAGCRSGTASASATARPRMANRRPFP